MVRLSTSQDLVGCNLLTTGASSLSLGRPSPLAHASVQARCIPRLCSPSQARLTFSLILRRASNTEFVTEQQGKRNTWPRAGKHQQNRRGRVCPSVCLDESSSGGPADC